MMLQDQQAAIHELDLKVAEWGDLDAGEKTALYKAAKKWLPFVVKVLAEKGASIHAEHMGKIGFSVQSDNMFCKKVRPLMERGANVSVLANRQALLTRALEKYVDDHVATCKCGARLFRLQCACNSVESLRILNDLAEVLVKCMREEGPMRFTIRAVEEVGAEAYLLKTVLANN